MDQGDLIGFVISAIPGIAALLAVILTYNKTRAEAHKIRDESDKVEEEREKVKAEREKIDVEAATIIQKAAFELNEQYKKRMEELETDSNKRMRALERASNQLKNHVINLEGQLREVLNCLVETVEGANKLFNQVKKHNEQPEYSPPSVELIKGRKDALLKHIEPLDPT